VGRLLFFRRLVRGERGIALAFGLLELFAELSIVVCVGFGSLSPEFAAGGEIANGDFGRSEFGFAGIGLRFPVVAALEEFGDEDAQGCTKRVANLSHRACAVHGGISWGEAKWKMREWNRSSNGCQDQLPISPHLPPPDLQPSLSPDGTPSPRSSRP